MSIIENSLAADMTQDILVTETPSSDVLWELRSEEQAYAKLFDPEVKQENRYGQKIDLLELTDHKAPINRSLNINDNPAVGCNPNRNKQHGFYFNADNCIGCHACESACAEKNETPSHLAFRSVGYVEGGTYPDFLRLNISMACNHCDDPVCLKGCPTAAIPNTLNMAPSYKILIPVLVAVIAPGFVLITRRNWIRLKARYQNATCVSTVWKWA